MNVIAVASFGALRFMLHDFAPKGGTPNFVLNIMRSRFDGDLVGEYVGQPIGIDPAVARAGLAAAESRGLDDEETQTLVIAHVVCDDSFEAGLSSASGGMPPQMRELFDTMRSLDEAKVLESTSLPPSIDVKAAPRRL